MCEKKGIFTDPLLMRRVATRGGVSRLTCWRRIFHWSIPSLHRRRGEGRIGGDVVSYVEYAIAAVYDDEEKKFVALATGF